MVDLLLHLPSRYEDRRRITPLAALRPEAEALVVAQVAAVEVRLAGRRSLVVTLADERAPGARLQLRLFHFGEVQRRGFVEGCWVAAFGAVRAGARGLEMIHPEYRLAETPASLALERGWVAVYPTTAGLTQARLRTLVARALDVAVRDGGLSKPLPGWEGMTTLVAVRQLHLPAASCEAEDLLEPQHPARRRLIEEELLAHQLALRRSRALVQARRAPPIGDVQAAAGRLQEQLPFALTGAQRRAIADVARDLASGRPMLRLVQGDVGSGKTLVAAAAMTGCATAGWQAVLMAPTELLAEQHARNLTAWLEPLGERVGLLSGRMKASEKRAALAAAADGTIRVWVGTHALFQGDVRFA
ncbi:MAG TPA: DEAD/DEAH box helicase, partial [Nevskiaceae bacterium]|nr:DEAD/DEAH box helicase [Nevskiaceae bacterium]